MGSSNFPISIFLHFLFTVSKIHHQWILWEKGKKRRRKTPCLTFFLDGEKLQNGCTISLTLFSYYKVLFFLLLWSRILLFYLPLLFLFFAARDCLKRFSVVSNCWRTKGLLLLGNWRMTCLSYSNMAMNRLLLIGYIYIYHIFHVFCSETCLM